nr:MAG TPA: hypothetical protein [Caudoviricetes sp.]
MLCFGSWLSRGFLRWGNVRSGRFEHLLRLREIHLFGSQTHKSASHAAPPLGVGGCCRRQVDAVCLLLKGENIVINAIVKLPCIGLLVGVRVEDTRQGVLRNLSYCTRMDEHEVDRETRSLGDFVAKLRLAIVQGDTGVEAVLRNANNRNAVIAVDFTIYTVLVREITGNVALECGIGLFRHEADQTLTRHFVVTHFCKRCINHCCNIGVCCNVSRGCLGDAGCACELRETVSVELRNNLGADKLTCQSAECHAESFLVVHAVNHEGNAAILRQLEGLPCAGYGTGLETAVSIIIRETVHVGLENLNGVCANKVHACCRNVENGGQRLALINLIKQRLKLLRKCNIVCHAYYSFLLAVGYRQPHKAAQLRILRCILVLTVQRIARRNAWLIVERACNSGFLLRLSERFLRCKNRVELTICERNGIRLCVLCGVANVKELCLVVRNHLFVAQTLKLLLHFGACLFILRSLDFCVGLLCTQLLFVFSSLAVCLAHRVLQAFKLCGVIVRQFKCLKSCKFLFCGHVRITFNFGSVDFCHCIFLLRFLVFPHLLCDLRLPCR